MRIFLLSFSVLLSSLTGNAQKLTLGVGLGIGNVVKSGIDHNGGKGVALLNGRYFLSERIALGIDLGTTGNLFPVRGTDNSLQGETLWPYDCRSNFLLGSGTYLWKKRKISPFVSLGLGWNTYFYNVFADDTRRTGRTNLAIAPAVGLEFDEFTFSLQYFLGGNTPSFSGTRDQQQTIELESESVSMLFLSVAYHFTVLR